MWALSRRTDFIGVWWSLDLGSFSFIFKSENGHANLHSALKSASLPSLSASIINRSLNEKNNSFVKEWVLVQISKHFTGTGLVNRDPASTLRGLSEDWGSKLQWRNLNPGLPLSSHTCAFCFTVQCHVSHSDKSVLRGYSGSLWVC